jgi:hypothetical protein
MCCCVASFHICWQQAQHGCCGNLTGCCDLSMRGSAIDAAQPREAERSQDLSNVQPETAASMRLWWCTLLHLLQWQRLPHMYIICCLHATVAGVTTSCMSAGGRLVVVVSFTVYCMLVPHPFMKDHTFFESHLWCACRFVCAGCVVELRVPDHSYHVASAFNDMSLHTFRA